MSLDHEMAVYKRSIKDWHDYVGQYVLIKGDEVCGFYASYEDALTAGYGRFGLEPFFVKEIHAIEQTHHVTRMIEPCHTSLVR